LVLLSTICKTIILTGPDSCQANFETVPVATNPLGKFFIALPWHSNQKKPERICWTFGDGEDTCINYNPSQPPPNGYGVYHLYSQPGTYTACVNIRYEGGCEAHFCRTLQIGQQDSCSANFEVSPVSSSILTKHFTAIPWHSNNKKPWKICWNFGDGNDTCITYTNTYQGPYTVNHTYASPGQYNVCVKIYYVGGCEATKCREVQVGTNHTCTADYEVAPVSSSILTKHFTAIPWHSNQNKPIYICWQFGDGTDTCIQYSNTYTGPYTVNHTYASPGQYNVCVKIVYAGGCMATKCRIVNVGESCHAQIFQITSSNTALTRGFHVVASSNPPRPIHSICWRFGDGTDTCLVATNSSPPPNTITHTFPGPGVYHTCVRVTFAGGCVAEKCIEVVIRNANGICGGYFTDSLSAPRTVYFHGQSIHSPGDAVLTYKWIFGDGAIAFGQNAVHTYAQNGIYTACLLINTSRGCETRICKKIVLGTSSNTPVLQLSPNPVINILHAVFYSTHTETVTIKITNSMGVVVRTYTRNASVGLNVWDFDLSTLPSGVYSFVVQSPNQMASAIFIKQ
jgi:PKD repeat protein